MVRKLVIGFNAAIFLYITININNLALRNSGLIKVLKKNDIDKTFEKKLEYNLNELSQEEPYRSRMIDIKNKCSKKKKTNSKSFLTSSFKFNDDVKVVMCETPKVASTTWQLLILRLGGYKDEIDQKLLREWAYDKIPNKQFSELKNEDDALAKLKSHVTFFLTRHPFERLVSAFSDKFTNRTDVRAYRDRVGKMIAKQQAKNFMHGMESWFPVLVLMKDKNINLLPQFQLLNSTQKEDVLKYVKVLRTGEISFAQFVRFIIKQYNNDEIDKMDVHWLPQTNLCMPCNHNYSYVIRFENLAQESNRLLNYLQKDIRKEHTKVIFPSSHLTKVKDEATKNAFMKILKKDVEILRLIYAEDFYVLNHDPYLYHGYS